MKIVTLVAIKVIHKKHGVFERAVKKPPCWVIHARRLYLSRQLVIYSRVHIQPWWGTCSFPFPLHFSNLQNICVPIILFTQKLCQVHSTDHSNCKIRDQFFGHWIDPHLLPFYKSLHMFKDGPVPPVQLRVTDLAYCQIGSGV